MCTVGNTKDQIDLEADIINFVVSNLLLFVPGLTITLCCYILTIRRIRLYQKTFPDQKETGSMKLLMYPGAILVTVIPSTIYGAFKLCLGIQYEVLDVGVMLITHLIGFTNALVYGYQRRINKLPSEKKPEAIEFRSEFRTSSRLES